MAVADKKELQRYLQKLQEIANNSVVNAEETEADKNTRKLKAKKDYNFFVSYYFPHYAEVACAPFHLAAAQDVLKDKHYKGIQEWARGLAKSTHFDIFIPLWLHLFHNQLNCMLLVGKNLSNAKRLLSDLQAECEANQQLIHDFGKLVKTGDWAEGNFYTATGAAFFALGKNQSPRGLRNGPNRPDYIVLDDADDDEECRNQQRVDDSVDWVLKALIPAMGSEITRFVMVNNRIAKYSILAKLAENKAFNHRRVNALDKNGEPSWPQKYSKEFYANLQKIIGVVAFLTEYMNEPNVEGKIFTDKVIQYKPALNYKKYDRIIAHWDIAYSEAKTADYNAIAIVGAIGNEKHVLHFFCQQCKMEVVIRWATMFNLQLPLGVYIEWYGERQFWADAVDIALQTVAKEMGHRLPIIFPERAGKGINKYARILQMVPTFQRGEVYFSEAQKFNTDMQTAIEQLKGIEPNYKTKDDAPDALEFCFSRIDASRVFADFEIQIGERYKPRRIY